MFTVHIPIHLRWIIFFTFLLFAVFCMLYHSPQHRYSFFQFLQFFVISFSKEFPRSFICSLIRKANEKKEKKPKQTGSEDHSKFLCIACSSIIIILINRTLNAKNIYLWNWSDCSPSNQPNKCNGLNKMDIYLVFPFFRVPWLKSFMRAPCAVFNLHDSLLNIWKTKYGIWTTEYECGI